MNPVDEFYNTVPATEPPQLIDALYANTRTLSQSHQLEARNLARLLCTIYVDVTVTKYGEDGFMQTYEELIIPANNEHIDSIILLISHVIRLCCISMRRLIPRAEIPRTHATDSGKALWDSISKTCENHNYQVLSDNDPILSTRLDSYLICCMDKGTRRMRKPTLLEAAFYFDGERLDCD